MQLTYPNVDKAEPGTKLLFISFDHATGKLIIDGTATVSADGSTAVTDPDSGITHPGWHFVIQGSPGEFQIGLGNGVPSDPLGGGADFDMSDGEFQALDQQFNDLLNKIPNLIAEIPGLGSLADPFSLSPVETAIRTAIRACYASGAAFEGASFGIVSRYYERFLSGVAEDIRGNRMSWI